MLRLDAAYPSSERSGESNAMTGVHIAMTGAGIKRYEKIRPVIGGHMKPRDVHIPEK